MNRFAETQWFEWKPEASPGHVQVLCIVLLTLLGSMVQKGKFSAGIDTLPSVLNSVLFPTFGNPTIPICVMKVKIKYTSKAGVIDSPQSKEAGIPNFCMLDGWTSPMETAEGDSKNEAHLQVGLESSQDRLLHWLFLLFGRHFVLLFMMGNQLR